MSDENSEILYEGEIRRMEENYLDTSKLKAGMTVRNYKELCALLGEEPKGGDAKKAQLANWERYFSFEKEEKKRSYYILEVYSAPLPKVEKRGRQSKYLGLIEIILLNFLLLQDNHSASLTQKEWWKRLGMVNNNFTNIDNVCDFINKNHKGIKNRFIYSFYEHVSRKMNSVLRSALKSLISRRLISCNTQVIIFSEGKFHEADKQEIENILTAERYVLTEEFYYDSIQDVYRNYDQEDYYSKVNAYVKKKYNYDFYYHKLEIIYNEENVTKVLSSKELWLTKFELNERLTSFHKQQAENYYEKLKVQYDNGRTDYIDPTFLETQNILINELINIRPENIDKFVATVERAERYKEQPRVINEDISLDADSLYKKLDEDDAYESEKIKEYEKEQEQEQDNDPEMEDINSLFYDLSDKHTSFDTLLSSIKPDPSLLDKDIDSRDFGLQ